MDNLVKLILNPLLEIVGILTMNSPRIRITPSPGRLYSLSYFTAYLLWEQIKDIHTQPKAGLEHTGGGKMASTTASTGRARRELTRYWVPMVKRRIKPFWESTSSKGVTYPTPVPKYPLWSVERR